MKHLLLIVFPLVAFAGLAVADEPQLLFEDSFDTELGDGWTWLRENPDYWRIHEGALEIRAEPGHAQTVKNALLRDAPDRSQHKFAVEVTVTFASEPTQQYEQAGITWYHDKAPVFKLVHERVDGKLLVVPGHKPAPPMTVRSASGRGWNEVDGAISSGWRRRVPDRRGRPVARAGRRHGQSAVLSWPRGRLRTGCVSTTFALYDSRTKGYRAQARSSCWDTRSTDTRSTEGFTARRPSHSGGRLKPCVACCEKSGIDGFGATNYAQIGAPGAWGLASIRQPRHPPGI